MMKAVIGVVPGGASGVTRWIRMCGVAAALFAVLGAGPAGAQQADTARMVDPDKAYRQLGARHLYETYGHRVYKGTLPPLLYAIAITETQIDENGNVVEAVIEREPASAKEVMPWILGLIRSASPFPKPGPGPTRYRDIWLIDERYMFQLDTLTEGQR